MINKRDTEILIEGLTCVQMHLQQKRRDHNGNVLKHDDIDILQEAIQVLINVGMDL